MSRGRGKSKGLFYGYILKCDGRKLLQSRKAGLQKIDKHRNSTIKNNSKLIIRVGTQISNSSCGISFNAQRNRLEIPHMENGCSEWQVVSKVEYRCFVLLVTIVAKP